MSGSAFGRGPYGRGPYSSDEPAEMAGAVILGGTRIAVRGSAVDRTAGAVSQGAGLVLVAGHPLWETAAPSCAAWTPIAPLVCCQGSNSAGGMFPSAAG